MWTCWLKTTDAVPRMKPLGRGLSIQVTTMSNGAQSGNPSAWNHHLLPPMKIESPRMAGSLFVLICLPSLSLSLSLFESRNCICANCCAEEESHCCHQHDAGEFKRG